MNSYSSTASWSRGRWWVAAALAAFVAVQVVVPAIGLFGARPARFGWQMYSVAEAAPQAWGEARDGSRTPIDLTGRLGVLRADTRDGTAIGTALCAGSVYGAVLIQFGDEPAKRVPCS
jgi:hypothetical protein